MKLTKDLRAIISGQSNSGKTVWLKTVLENQKEVFESPFDKILYCYTVYQDVFDEMQNEIPNFQAIAGFPTDEVLNSSSPTLFIFDDFLNTLTKENENQWVSLFTKMRHKNKATIIITQNLFAKENLVLRRNANLLVLFPNIGARSMIKQLSHQIFPDSKGFLYDAFMKVTKTPYNPLLIDLRVTTQEELRVFEGILPGQETFFYVPAKLLGQAKNEIEITSDHVVRSAKFDR